MFRKHVVKMLSAYHQGELSRENSRQVTKHLLGCATCREAYDEIRFGIDLAKSLPHQSAPASLWNDLVRLLDEPPRAVTRKYLQVGSLIRRPRMAVLTIGALLAVALVVIWYSTRPLRGSWEVTRIEGTPTIGSHRVSNTSRLMTGEWLETDELSRAEIYVGKIGQVEIGPNTRVRLVKARTSEHRLALQRGTMHATIWAPPRLFFVETPSAVAVDLGCAYTLKVDDTGAGILRVTFGWVAFERTGRESFVPMGAQCATRPGIGPGTPYFEDASPSFVASLTKLDFEKLSRDGYSAQLVVVLSEARVRDAFTLWHLLPRVKDSERPQVYDRLAALVPPPNSVTRQGVLEGNRHMLDLWWDALGLGDTNWWRSWKASPPPLK